MEEESGDEAVAEGEEEEDAEEEGDEVEEGDEAEDVEEEGEADAAESDEDQPDELEAFTFAGLDTEDLDEGDDDMVQSEPSFNDKKLPAWKDLGLHNTVKQGLLGLGFKKPTDIQRRAIPKAAEGHDIVGVAETVSSAMRSQR